MTSNGVLAPVTEADQLRQQLLQAQRLSSVGALASSVAHEFNNILTTIINYAKLGLRPSADDQARTQALERILKGGHRAAGIVNSMLGYARANATLRVPTDVARLVEEALTLTEKDLSKHRIHVERRFHAPPLAPVAPGQIEQPLVTLITTAGRAIPRGGGLLIGARDTPPAGMAEVRIADSGIGIAPDRLRLIFEPFYTTKEPDELGHGGTGLGLSVCRQIIEQHQGRIRVESLVGKGSTFTVKLPLKVEPA